ncbi:ROK family protein [Agromyces protaetiae]|uniref:ROK family protein n=1 Tax=Agromyces protaetiae TaxID=2509455 RepID=A0A4P6F8I3_9MICO|nr:ROK family protein [Agromyces protaetiae]QAY72410.1 ROK family protein [Agromyces protaetiae]
MTPLDSSSHESHDFEHPPFDGARLQHSVLLLDYLVDHGPTTRSELSAATGLGRSAIAAVTARLLEVGVLAEEADASSDGRATPLALAAANHVLVTTAITADDAIATVASLDGAELARFGEPHSVADRGGLLELLSVVLRRALSYADRGGFPVADVTLLVDGSVAGTPEVVVGSGRFGPEPIDVAAELRARVPALGDTVTVVPAAIAAATAEGDALGVRDLLYLDGDTAIGSAIIVDGRPLRGGHGLAASLAHLPIVPSGRRCECGQRGCLATVADPSQVIERAGLARLEADRGRTAALEELLVRLEASEDRATWSWLDAALWIGRTLQAVAPALDPAVVVVGGYWGRLVGDIEKSFRENRPTIGGGVLASVPLLAAATLGSDAALVGARRQARGRLVAEPMLLVG